MKPSPDARRELAEGLREGFREEMDLEEALEVYLDESVYEAEVRKDERRRVAAVLEAGLVYEDEVSQAALRFAAENVRGLS